MHSQKAGHLATLAALVLLAVVLAYWTWAWLAPPPAPRAPAAVQGAYRASAAGSLFGAATQRAGSGAIRLMGVVAAAGEQRGQAVLQLDGKQSVAVLQGEEVAPGLRLAEVHVDHVVLERNGVREALAWPGKVGK
jgi:general secretion pathway protein C